MECSGCCYALSKYEAWKCNFSQKYRTEGMIARSGAFCPSGSDEVCKSSRGGLPCIISVIVKTIQTSQLPRVRKRTEQSSGVQWLHAKCYQNMKPGNAVFRKKYWTEGMIARSGTFCPSGSDEVCKSSRGICHV